MNNNKLTQSEKDLIKKIENKQTKTNSFDKLKESYLEQTDRNYKDGDKN
ncbi:MAG: hypothetical protein ACRC5M_06370 [Anaeroplasmataceae bacterium]